jgi:hypothetical protein
MLPSKDRAPACRDSLAADDPHVRERLMRAADHPEDPGRGLLLLQRLTEGLRRDVSV